MAVKDDAFTYNVGPQYDEESASTSREILKLCCTDLMRARQRMRIEPGIVQTRLHLPTVESDNDVDLELVFAYDAVYKT